MPSKVPTERVKASRRRNSAAQRRALRELVERHQVEYRALYLKHLGELRESMPLPPRLDGK